MSLEEEIKWMERRTIEGRKNVVEPFPVNINSGVASYSKVAPEKDTIEIPFRYRVGIVIQSHPVIVVLMVPALSLLMGYAYGKCKFEVSLFVCLYFGVAWMQMSFGKYIEYVLHAPSEKLVGYEEMLLNKSYFHYLYLYNMVFSISAYVFPVLLFVKGYWLVASLMFLLSFITTVLLESALKSRLMAMLSILILPISLFVMIWLLLKI